jgi:hypothetical protein
MTYKIRTCYMYFATLCPLLLSTSTDAQRIRSLVLSSVSMSTCGHGKLYDKQHSFTIPFNHEVTYFTAQYTLKRVECLSSVVS